MSRLIDADALYERAHNLEAQALDYVGKLIERDGDTVSVEWKIWSAILTERTAFKHDVFDAPTIDAVKVVRCGQCKHRVFAEYNGAFHLLCERIDGVEVRPNDYCSNGVRK